MASPKLLALPEILLVCVGGIAQRGGGGVVAIADELDVTEEWMDEDEDVEADMGRG